MCKIEGVGLGLGLYRALKRLSHALMVLTFFFQIRWGGKHRRPLARRAEDSRVEPMCEELMRERKRDSRSSAAASSSALSSELLPPRVCAHFFRELSPPFLEASTLPPQSSPCPPNPSRSRPLCVRDDGRTGDVAPAAEPPPAPAPATVSRQRRTSAFAACAHAQNVSARARAGLSRALGFRVQAQG